MQIRVKKKQQGKKSDYSEKCPENGQKWSTNGSTDYKQNKIYCHGPISVNKQALQKSLI